MGGLYQKIGCGIGGNFSTVVKNISSRHRWVHHSAKVLVVGGGTGGCTMAAKFARKFKKSSKDVVVIEPSEIHYYQPMFTLIGGGIRSFESSKKEMKDVLPKNVTWLKDSVMKFEPDENRVVTSNGDTVEYETIIIAMGVQLLWDKIPGLIEGLRNPDAQVCSIYGPETVTHVLSKIKKTKSGTAIFTFPNSPVKCPGAPQKIAYIAEDLFRKVGVRNNIEVVYNTSLPVIFGVKKYADALWEVCNKRNIIVNLQTNLIEINSDKKEAVFQNLNEPDKKITQQYSLLHVCPPMGPPNILKSHPSLTNEAGFLTVNPKTLQHIKYSNVFGIGDCTSSPNSKTMAAIAAQAQVVYQNVLYDMEKKPLTMVYDGYASCPLVTGYGKCILAEFDYNLQPMETFPLNQGKERYFMYILKKYFFPFLYWNLMLKGYWNGPGFFRRFTNLVK